MAAGDFCTVFSTEYSGVIVYIAGRTPHIVVSSTPKRTRLTLMFVTDDGARRSTKGYKCEGMYESSVGEPGKASPLECGML